MSGPTAAAQSVDLDRQPTGFLTATTGGMPGTAWAGTSLTPARLFAVETAIAYGL